MGSAPITERIIVQAFETEQDAFFAEMLLIAAYGRKDQGTGCLLNLTDGGENPPSFRGKKRSEQWLAKRRGHRHTPESIALMSAKQTTRFADKTKHPWFGKTRSEETCRKLSIAKQGEKNPRFGKPPIINSKLRPEQVEEIRALLAQGQKQNSVAKQFGVGQTIISRIFTGQRWNRKTNVSRTNPC